MKDDISEYIPDSIGGYVGIGDKPQTTNTRIAAAAETRTPAQLPHNFEQPYVKLNHLEVTPQYERPLITYAYHETDFARKNLEFFLAHGLHAAADFVFIFNGETDADKLVWKDPLAEIPKDIRHLFPARPLDNVLVKKRQNTCFDLGAHAEVLNQAIGEDEGWLDKNGKVKKARGQRLRDSHKRFILMNSSIRGPFLPPWSNDCWSDAYLNKLTAKTKLIGMAYNCHSLVGHVQSMIWATDKTGIDLILTKDGIGECFAEIGRAMDAEVRTTQMLRENGYEVDSFLQIYHSEDKEAKWARMRAKMNAGKEQFKRVADAPAPAQPSSTSKPILHPDDDISAKTQDYDAQLLSDENGAPGYMWRECKEEDWLGPHSYAGSFVHPYENLFYKSHRGIGEQVLGNLTEWVNEQGTNSWDVCL